MDLFHLNMPYGIEKNEEGKWCYFNRYYSHLGKMDGVRNDEGHYIHAPKLSEKILLQVCETHSQSFSRGEDGSISKIYFYDAHTDPSYLNELSGINWENYLKRLCKVAEYLPF